MNKWKYYDRILEFTKDLSIDSSAWSGHYSFAYDLVANTKPKIIVELGTHKGNSLFSFSQAVKDFNLDTEIHAIDTWEGDSQTGYYGNEIFTEFKKIVNKYYQNVNIVPHKKYFDDAIKEFENNSIDILHIDGLHTYEAVKHDFETWLPKVKKKNGIILLHDVCETQGDFGVYKLWEELCKKYQKTITFPHSHGLGVILFGNPKIELKETFIKHYLEQAKNSETKVIPSNIIDVFCSVSQSRLKELNTLLIPSLEEQNVSSAIMLHLINYRADRKVLIDDILNTRKIAVDILNPSHQLGFGGAMNFGFNMINSHKFFLYINPDTYLDSSCIKQMIQSFDKKVGLIEARQLPFSHPKDLPLPHTFETPWASGSCLLINSKFFKNVQGFDENYWMYLEDVDLSWKAWINGYSVLQNPEAVVYHYTGVYFRYSQNSYEIEHFWSIRNFLYISLVFFGKKGLKKAFDLIDKQGFDKDLKNEAIKNFQELAKHNKIPQINVPKNLLDKIKIYDFNKFSKYP